MDTNNTENTEKVVTRFAPSPTGFMHVGGVRTALYAYLFAKKNNGTFILRIEDTDKEREVDGAIDQIKKSLRYILQDPSSPKAFPTEQDLINETLNPWNEFYIQSQRLGLYKEWAQKLVEAGYAYFDPYTKEELEAFRQKAQDAKIPFLFRNYRPETLDTDWDSNIVTDGTAFTFKKPLRFKVADVSRSSWTDAVRGNLEAGAEALDDFILMKTDGYPTYNFCHIVDDIDMGVTHVMRGEEFVSSTPKFISLYSALQKVFPEKNITIPKFVTLPPILGETGTKKLSKRDGAKDVLDYYHEGYLPSALSNFLAFQGWNPGGEKELYTMKELVQAFTIERIQKSGARWNPVKLEWFNKEHMSSNQVFGNTLNETLLCKTFLKHLPEEIENKLNENSNYRTGAEYTYSFIYLCKKYLERISYFDQLKQEPILSELKIIVEKPVVDLELIYGDLDKAEIKNNLENIILNLNEYQGNWEPELLKASLSDLIQNKGTKNILHPLRTALSGQKKSLDPFSLLTILGKIESQNRIQNVLTKMNV